MTAEFVPASFQVPLSLELEEFRFEVLSPSVAEIDYEAVMTSKMRLRSVFSQSTEWPRDGMTLDENIDDLIRHEKEFKSREAFAYTVLSPDKSKCIGCIYIRPSRVSQFDSETYCWVRDDSLDLDGKLFSALKNWLIESWPFENVAFPGRDLSWSEWDATSNQS